ncbi:heterokaryon incompatibility protein-domain-containing protein [Leptodontidium sp. 2 PMI_412]|nr:heterokaryon incompatibility protein-domain-containing protein [Leptodontidium sp. 2 PMI_412]
MSRYTYARLLDAADIRILELSPGKGKEEVVVQLSSTPLKTAPHYEALSYTWGDPTITRSILCSDGVVSVTTNLHDALANLRYKDRPRYLWVDAICINQTDSEEKSTQIPLMGEIYSSAQQVVVWLGRMTDDVTGVFSCLRKMEKFVPMYGYGSFNMDRFMRLDYSAVVNLFQRPYFRRRWIVQEVVKSNHAIAVCGHETIPWLTIESVASGIFARGLSSLMTPEEDEQMGFSAMNNIATIRAGKVKRSLFNLRKATWLFECTSPHDRLYSLLGMASDLHEYDDIKPDYTLSHVDVFTKFAASSILRNMDLDILPPCSMSEAPMPSWVQQFDKYSMLGTIKIPESGWSFNATKDTPVQCSFSDDGHVLRVSGKSVDIIKSIVPTPANTPVDEFPGDLDELMAALEVSSGPLNTMARQAMYLLASRKLAAGDNLESFLLDSNKYEQFCRVLLCDTPYRERASGEFVEPLTKLFALQELFCGGPTTEIVDRLPECIDLAQSIGPLLSLITFHRSFCITGEGRMGEMPQNAKVGDLVCVLFGGKVPYVLRPRGDGRYTYVGDCFVYGLMDGEAMDMENIQAQEFALV